MREDNTGNIDRAAHLQAVNDLRNAMYNFEFKTAANLQLINGGGAAVLVGFLSRPEMVCKVSCKCMFLGAIILFVIGLMASFSLALIYPSYLESRYLKGESAHRDNEFAKQDSIRKTCVYVGVGCFLLAIVLSVFGWMSFYR